VSIPTSVDFGASSTNFSPPQVALATYCLTATEKSTIPPLFRLETMGNSNRKSYIFACALLAAATGGQAQQFCSCSPTQFEFVLTLDQSCDVNGENNFL